MSFPCPYLVSILETVPCYPSGTYEITVLGFGKPTREEAEQLAEEAVRRLSRIQHAIGPGLTASRAHRAVFSRPCEACMLSGLKKGCKRKPCEACDGKGTLPGFAA